MVSLIDIGSLSRTVSVRGQDLPVYAISARAFVNLLDRFPPFRRMMADRAGDLGVADVLKMAPDLVASVIAAGLGKIGDADTERAAAELGIGEQADILEAVFDITFPRGVGPFVETLRRLGLISVSEDALSAASADTGRGSAGTSPSQYNGASGPDIPQTQPGDTVPASSPDSPS